MKKIIIMMLVTILMYNIYNASEILTPAQYHRNPEQTYITFPEWWLVYASDEYAEFIKDKNPSDFPYFGLIGQFWSNYWKIYQITKKEYPFDIGSHVMLLTIGISTTLEYSIKSLYERTIGRLTELSRTNLHTKEDKIAYDLARDYADFIYAEPWYKFDFASKAQQIWNQPEFNGPDKIRKIERRFFLTLEYSFKAAYAWLIKQATEASYDEQATITTVITSGVDKAVLKQNSRITLLNQFKNGSQLLSLPRYDAFKDAALSLAQNGVVFYEISGNNSEILLSYITKENWKYNLKSGTLLLTNKIITTPWLKRIIIKTPIASLHEVLLGLKKEGAVLEHIYDY
jgi:hypothetical protein